MFLLQPILLSLGMNGFYGNHMKSLGDTENDIYPMRFFHLYFTG